jgi:hypothetical protein
MGRNGLVVGNNNDSWSIGGGASVDMGPRQGDTFSRVNLKSELNIDPFVTGHALVPAIYDFGLAFNGFGPHRTAQYRFVSVQTALILAGVWDVDKLPVISVLGSGQTWQDWKWRSQPIIVDDVVILRSGNRGLKSMLANELDGRWLVYRVRVKDSSKAPMRIQVNWHAKQDNRFLTRTIKIVYPTETWHSYPVLLNAPKGADMGSVYISLHKPAQGEVELQSVELK